MKQISFLAFDLGATSGRTILGTLNEGKLQMKELTRFPNQILELNGHAYWNIFSLYEHLKAGMIAAAKEDVEITSIGIDTWGVDFVFLGEDGQILGIPHAYRDQHTAGAPEEYFEKVLPRKEVYDITGIQIMNFNSLYQALRDEARQLVAAERRERSAVHSGRAELHADRQESGRIYDRIHVADTEPAHQEVRNLPARKNGREGQPVRRHRDAGLRDRYADRCAGRRNRTGQTAGGSRCRS